jgi:hypothetical protein
MRTHFFILGIQIKRLERICLCDFLMAPRINSLSFRRLKKRLWYRRWSDVSRCRKAMRNHFLHHGHRKNRLARIRYVLSRRMALRTHILPRGLLKKRLCEVDESMFQGVERPWKTFFLLPWHRKSDFGRNPLSVVLSTRMALRTHNMPSECLKKRAVL